MHDKFLDYIYQIVTPEKWTPNRQFYRLWLNAAIAMTNTISLCVFVSHNTEIFRAKYAQAVIQLILSNLELIYQYLL